MITRKVPLVAVVVALTLTLASTARALPISATDLWQGATITASTGAHTASNLNNMFGAMLGFSEVGNAVFRDGAPTGTVHALEWQTSSAVTLRSFVLNAAHDGTPRDARYRGFSTFRLFAWDGSEFDEIFSYNPANPYSASVAPTNGYLDVLGFNVLSLGVNLAAVTTNRFRAEFVQFGLVDPSASGPRIMELDGFNTYLTQASIPGAVPAPAALALLGLGLIGVAATRRNAPMREK